MSKLKNFRKNDVDLSSLSDWETEVLGLFEQLSIIATRLFNLQHIEGSKVSFYPEGVTKEEIIEESKSNPDILNKFTVVKKENGQLTSTDYYSEYRVDLDSAIEIIKKAAEKYEDTGYKKYLTQLAEDIKSNDYSESELLYAKINSNRLDIHWGPLESYSDNLFGIKRAFTSTVRIPSNSSDQHLFEDYIDVISHIYPETPFGAESGKLDLNIRVDDVIIEGGWHAYTIGPGSNYPKYPLLNGKKTNWAKVLVYVNNLEENDKTQLREVFERAFSKHLVDEHLGKDKEMNQEKVKFYALMNMGQAIIRHDVPDLKKRLGSYADMIREAQAKLIGIKAAGVQVLKGLEEAESYKAMLLFLPLIGLKIWQFSQTRDQDYREAFSRGYIIMLDYFVENGAIVFDDEDKIDFDYTKLYAAIDSLSNMFQEIIEKGTLEDIKSLVDKYSSTEIFQKYYK